MANLSKTRTLFAFTSPRTIEKIIPEINVLIKGYSGKIWNTETQIKFFKDLFKSEFYEGSKMPDNISLAARDRITRAPKALGFVDLKPVIKITDVGEALLSGKRTHEIIAKQLLKFQLPSPYHKLPTETYCIKPYLELLRLVKELREYFKNRNCTIFCSAYTLQKFD